MLIELLLQWVLKNIYSEKVNLVMLRRNGKLIKDP